MKEARPFSVVGAAVSGGIINLLINAGIGYTLVKPGMSLPTWGAPGVALDLVLTAFGIAFATGLLATPQTRKQIAQGRVLAPALSAEVRGMFNSWPAGLMHRSINLGFLSLAVLVPLPLLLLWLFGVHEVDRTTMVLLKGGFSLVVGAIVTPIIAIGAFFPEAAAGTAAQP